MKPDYRDITARHQQLLQQQSKEPSPDFINTVGSYISEVVAVGAEINDIREREQLRAILRYWSSYVYSQTKKYPPSQLAPSKQRPRLAGLPVSLAYVLLGLAIGLSLMAIGWRLFAPFLTPAVPTIVVLTPTKATLTPSTTPSPSPVPTPSATPTPSPTATEVPGALFSFSSVGTVGAVAFSPDGKFLAAGDANGIVSSCPRSG